MTIEEMKQRKRELGLTNADLAERTGVPIGTLNKIFSGQTKSPRRETILALESALTCRRGSSKQNLYSSVMQAEGAYIVSEPEIKYMVGTNPTKKVPGEYTYEDYLALPDDVRVELIDGYFYEMAAPSFVHQLIASELFYQLKDFVNKNKGSCKPVISPLDVQLDEDDKTIVQPDVLVICDPKAKLKNGRIWGAPDLVIEILSPSTRRRDLTLKLSKYSEAGLRELWYVDTKGLRVMTYDLESEDLFPVLYTFNDSIPVHIWNNECLVDFTRVYEDIKDFLD